MTVAGKPAPNGRLSLLGGPTLASWRLGVQSRFRVHGHLTARGSIIVALPGGGPGCRGGRMSVLRWSVASVVLAVLLAVFTFAGHGSAAPAAAPAPAGVENPEYTVWAKFKDGSSFTLAQDREIGGEKKIKVHSEVTNRLVRITPDRAVVESASVTEIGGEVTRTTPARKEI